MDYIQASANLQKFRNQTKDITPGLASDWVIKTDYYYQQGTKAIVSSKSLGQNIDCGESGRFMEENFLSGNIVISDGKVASFENNTLNNNLAYTKDGFISEENFYLSEDIVEQMNQNTPFKPSELKVSSVYKSMEDFYYIFLGTPNEDYISLDGLNTTITHGIEGKEKKKYLLQINKDKYLKDRTYSFDGITERKPKIKLIEEFESINTDKFKEALIYLYNDFDSSFLGLSSSFHKPKECILKTYNINLFKFKKDFYLFNETKRIVENDITFLSEGKGYYSTNTYFKINFDKFLEDVKKQVENKISSQKITAFIEDTLYAAEFGYKEKDPREILFIK